MKVHVFGASGYGGAECVALLAAHPFVELGAIESGSSAGEPVGKHFPRLRKLNRRFDAPGTIEASVADGDVVILAGPNGAAKQVAPSFLAKDARIIDLSADFRLAPSDAVYGLPERYREQIKTARLVANPGCYPTAVLLATLPLVTMSPSASSGQALSKGGITQIIVDAKSGITGAGRTPAVSSMFAEVSGEIRAYGLGGHRHEPEMLQELSAAGISAHLLFTPHVVPIARGLLADAYCIASNPIEPNAVRAAFERFYSGSPFVRILEEEIAPSIAAVAFTNDAEINVSFRGNIIRSICAIDNLGKGAAGQAVQNLNLMLGFPEESGLCHPEQREGPRTRSGAAASAASGYGNV